MDTAPGLKRIRTLDLDLQAHLPRPESCRHRSRRRSSTVPKATFADRRSTEARCRCRRDGPGPNRERSSVGKEHFAGEAAAARRRRHGASPYSIVGDNPDRAHQPINRSGRRRAAPNGWRIGTERHLSLHDRYRSNGRSALSGRLPSPGRAGSPGRPEDPAGISDADRRRRNRRWKSKSRRVRISSQTRFRKSHDEPISATSRMRCNTSGDLTGATSRDSSALSPCVDITMTAFPPVRRRAQQSAVTLVVWRRPSSEIRRTAIQGPHAILRPRSGYWMAVMAVRRRLGTRPRGVRPHAYALMDIDLAAHIETLQAAT